MTTLLETKNLCAFYDTLEILHGIDLSVKKGRITLLIGANGAGKTTIFRAISQLLRLTGSVQFDGKEISGKEASLVTRLGISHVPEDRGIFSKMTAEENLRLGIINRKDTAQIKQDFEKIYSYFPILTQRRKQIAGTMSGGELQMLAFARALLQRPRLLLLDEPSAGLSPIMVETLLTIIERINQQDGVTILLAEQMVSLVLDIAHYVYVLETGKIVLEGRPVVVTENKQLRQAYLGY